MPTARLSDSRDGSSDEFRIAAEEHAEWIAHYLGHVRELPVLPDIGPGQFRAQIDGGPPAIGRSFAELLRDFDSQIVPALTLWNHPRFFAWFSNSATPPSILAEFLAAAVNVNAMLWKSSPAATELEQVTLGWLRQWLHLPEEFFGIIYDTASIGVLQALGAARESMAPEFRHTGVSPGLVVYISDQTHSSSEKAAITLGFGRDNVRKIAADERFRMRADLLEAAINTDVAAGKRPCCIVATVGSTSTSAIDPIPAIAAIARKYGIWLHVDAAYGGPAAIVPELQSIFDGVAEADSVVVNPHKWLYVTVDCSVLYTRHPGILRRASALETEVLRTSYDDQVVNYNDYGMQLGRRFRALKLWYVFSYYGHSGLVEMLRESVRLAQRFGNWVERHEDWELMAPIPLSLVCFRHKAGDRMNREILDAVNRSGHAFLSHTVLNGSFVLRLAVGNFQTTEDDLRSTWQLLQEAAVQPPAVVEPAGVSR